MSNYHYFTASFFLSEPNTEPPNTTDQSDTETKSESHSDMKKSEPHTHLERVVDLDMILPIEQGLEFGWNKVIKELTKRGSRVKQYGNHSDTNSDTTSLNFKTLKSNSSNGGVPMVNKNDRVRMKYAQLLLQVKSSKAMTQLLCRYLSQDYNCFSDHYQPNILCRSNTAQTTAQIDEKEDVKEEKEDVQEGEEEVGDNVQLKYLVERHMNVSMSTEEVSYILFGRSQRKSSQGNHTRRNNTRIRRRNNTHIRTVQLQLQPSTIIVPTSDQFRDQPKEPISVNIDHVIFTASDNTTFFLLPHSFVPVIMFIFLLRYIGMRHRARIPTRASTR